MKKACDQQPSEPTTRRDNADVLAEIAEQAITGSALTPAAEEWYYALPQINAACEWQCKDSLMTSYMWNEDGDYYASNLPSGLEDREGVPLSRTEAIALLEGGISHKPVPLEDVKNQ